MRDGAVPQGWVSCPIREAGRVQLGRQRSPSNHAGTHMRPYLRVANVFEDRIDISDVMQMNFTPDEFERFRLRPGDVLLNEGQSLELVGRPAIYRDQLPGTCFTNSLIRFQPYPGILPEYACYVFRHAMHNGRFAKIAKITTNIAHLGAGRFANLEFPLPPTNEQRRIVEALETHFTRLDAAVAMLERVRANLKRYRAAVLQAAVEGRLGTTGRSDEWRTVPVSKLAWGSSYGTSAKCSYEGNGMPVLRIPNVAAGRIELSDMKFAIGDLPVALPDVLHPGDFLVVRTNGSRSLIGRGALVVVPMKRPTHFASYLIRLRLRDADRLGSWVGIVWHSPSMRATIEAAAATSAGQYNLSLRSILGFRVPLPSAPEIPNIVAAVDSHISVAEAADHLVDAQLARCARLRQSLLRLAFHGRLVPQDARDEPASVLLDRIRAERTVAPRSPKKQSARIRR